MTLNIAAIREQFPILRQTIHGKPLVYLDSAATAQKPRSVIQAMTHYYEHDHANVHRAIHTLSDRATDAYEGARAAVATFLGAPSPRHICFNRGTTEGLNFLAQTLAHSYLKPGDEVIISRMEHHANILPWQVLAKQCGIEVRVCELLPDGSLDLDHYRRLIASDRAALVSITHVSNVLGTVNPIKSLIAEAHQRDIPVIVDGAQGAPHMPVDVQGLGCDFYVFSGHKAYGPTGIGVLYMAEPWLDRLPPYQLGGSMMKQATMETVEYQEAPHRFEAGTPAIAEAVGLHAALNWLQDLGMDQVKQHGDALMRHAIAELRAIPGLHLVGDASERASAITLVVDGCHAFDMSTLLDHHGIAVRAGHLCAMPLLHHLGYQAVLRVSFGIYNHHEDIERLLTALKSVIATLRD